MPPPSPPKGKIGELLHNGMRLCNLTTFHGAIPPEGAEVHTGKAPGVLAARLNGMGGTQNSPTP